MVPLRNSCPCSLLDLSLFLPLNHFCPLGTGELSSYQDDFQLYGSQHKSWDSTKETGNTVFKKQHVFTRQPAGTLPSALQALFGLLTFWATWSPRRMRSMASVCLLSGGLCRGISCSPTPAEMMLQEVLRVMGQVEELATCLCR